MAIQRIVYLALSFILIATVLVIAIKTDVLRPERHSAYCGRNIALSEILNKTNGYSFSYINVNGHRIAAVDDKGNRYFYIYSRSSELAIIVDDDNMPILNSKCP